MSEVRVAINEARELKFVRWREMQDIAGEAYACSLQKTRTPQEIGNLIDADDPRRYSDSHQDPNTEVGKHFNDNQSYSNPMVARAFIDEQLVGWGYTANNISGNKIVRELKKLSVAKNYLWLREIVVKPEFMRRGIASEIGRTLLQIASQNQPVSHYSWSNEDPAFVAKKLLDLGFIPEDSQDKEIFGKGSRLTKQTRWVAPSVKSVLSLL